MASKKIEGPYEVRPVREYSGIVGYQVIGIMFRPGEFESMPQGLCVVASDVYQQRQGAYRRCAELNRESQKRQMIGEIPPR